METEQLISVLHTCFTVFLVVAVIMVILSVALFFLLNIVEVFNIMTGRAVRKTVQEMEEANNSTGRLRKVNKIAMGDITAPTMTDELIANSVTESLQNNAAQTEAQGSENTTVLNEGTGDTTLLNSGETSVLSMVNIHTNDEKNQQPINIGKFLIVKSEMLIHTDEVI